MAFVVIEGLDGSGKSTQLKLLREYLSSKPVRFRYLHFPRLEEGVYGELIARFLRGELGSIDQVNPYLVAMLFAGDRADAAAQIRRWISKGLMVVADRYVYSNIAFQGAKIRDEKERLRLMDWIMKLEFDHNRLPRPDLNIFLDVPLEFVLKQLGTKRDGQDRSYLKGEMDIHEENLDFQEGVHRVYHALRDHVEDLRLVQCMDDRGGMLPPGVISEKIIKEIEQL